MAAGATGGHIMPALSIARAMEESYPGTEVVFVGTGRPAEETILGPFGYRRFNLNMTGLKGKGLIGAPKAAWQAGLALAKSANIVRSFKPHLGLVTGGYVSGPVGMALKLSGTPLVLHEQNSLPGLTNRLLGTIADLILVAFPQALEKFSKKRTKLVGNPVRPEITAIGSIDRNFEEKPFKLLILGGSQGSRALNAAGLNLAVYLMTQGLDLEVIHQTGAAEFEDIKQKYIKLGIKATVEPFFSDMAAIYKLSHLAVTRAGALTVFELAAARVPSILVPLPTAADDHQSVNAMALVNFGLAAMVKERDLGHLNEIAYSLIKEPEKLRAMHASSYKKSDVLRPYEPKQIASLLRGYIRDI
jgi:UDP-N-acetylglucosamine--N-acetylmuramyl-(pentapeptide) pyrophosphoryl-undecaprenol N-acetylglucosamine transferase